MRGLGEVWVIQPPRLSGSHIGGKWCGGVGQDGTCGCPDEGLVTSCVGGGWVWDDACGGQCKGELDWLAGEEWVFL